MVETSADRALMALLALDAMAAPERAEEIAPAIRVRLPTLDERVELYLRALHAPPFTAAERLSAREVILDAMALDAIESASGSPALPARRETAATMAAHVATRQGRTVGELAQAFLKLLWPPVDGLGLRSARLAAVPLVALLLVGTLWKGGLLSPDQGLPTSDITPVPASGSNPSPATLSVPTRGLASSPASGPPAARVGPSGKSEESLRAQISDTEAAGKPGVQLADLLVELGGICRAEGRLSEAAALYERAVTIRERAFGPSDRGVGETLETLVSIYRAQGRANEADAASQRAQSTRQDAPRR